ncbi:hypothetical protein [Alicyclobacillus fastidiosus]|uniref:Transposase n=1 Tax=Alicyclobacillus fastidiosus TaxID=392011 RepID=A0ABV5ALN0_9BACL|nr:hypothetical protein [Alicyclobacillus fastidiosus]WEH08482.1 hypothetical protein PYS47_17570 [Alicyclobacillus fastidiosus]
MYVKHPVMCGNGTVSVVMPDGTTKQLPMVEGVIDWPENVPLHNGFKPSPEPEALRELKRKEKEEELRRLAEELGFDVSAQKKTSGKKSDDKKAE